MRHDPPTMKLRWRGMKLDLSIAIVVMVLVLIHTSGVTYRRELSRMFARDHGQEMRVRRMFREIRDAAPRETDSPGRDEEAVGKSLRETASRTFHRRITEDALYESSASYVFELLQELSTTEIVEASLFPGGTQVKFRLKFANGNVAIAKPKRHERGRHWAYNQSEPFWLDRERHNAEIAAFHLDRVLNFRRTPPCVGRVVHFEKEILRKTEDANITRTLYERDDGSHCFIGSCVPWICNRENPICSEGSFMELSVCQLVYPSVQHPFQDRPYPWSQGLLEARVWKERNICTEMLMDPEISEGRFFLDLIDLSIFDHLIQNYDRHHFTIVVRYAAESFVVSVDNGKGFGNPLKNDISFLAPLYQCCRIRNSTYHTLVDLTRHERRLGNLLRFSLSQDPLAPVLADEFYTALDRRLDQVMDELENCISHYGREAVVVDKMRATEYL